MYMQPTWNPIREDKTIYDHCPCCLLRLGPMSHQRRQLLVDGGHAGEGVPPAQEDEHDAARHAVARHRPLPLLGRKQPLLLPPLPPPSRAGLGHPHAHHQVLQQNPAGPSCPCWEPAGAVQLVSAWQGLFVVSRSPMKSA